MHILLPQPLWVLGAWQRVPPTLSVSVRLLWSSFKLCVISIASIVSLHTTGSPHLQSQPALGQEYFSSSVLNSDSPFSCLFPSNSTTQQQFIYSFGLVLDVFCNLGVILSMRRIYTCFMQLQCHFCKWPEHAQILISERSWDQFPHGYWKMTVIQDFIKN